MAVAAKQYILDEDKDRANHSVPIKEFCETQYGLKFDRNNKALCPFPDHHDTDPSFAIYSDTNTFKCYGCGRSGDLLQLVMEMEGCSFIEAYERITGEKVQRPKKSQQQQGAASKSMNPFFDGSAFLVNEVVAEILKRFKVFYDGSFFYMYSQGYWQTVHHDILSKVVADLLEDRAKPAYIRDTLRMLEIQTHVSPEQIKKNQSGNLINVLNCVLDMDSMAELSHSPDFLFTTQIPHEFDRKAECPLWLQSLSQWCSDDPGKALCLQDFFGYCLLPKIFIHNSLFFIGAGCNGKSVILNMLARLVGYTSVCCLELHQLSDKFLLGVLRDKLVNIASDIDTKTRAETGILKQVISGDIVQADIKFKAPVLFRPFAKHIFSMNETPIITDRTFGLQRRLLILRFRQTFAGNENNHLEDELALELPGIFNWALVGLARVLDTNKITETEIMKLDKNDFLQHLNPVTTFVEEACILDSTEMEYRTDIYNAYSTWCNESGVKRLSKSKFYEQLASDYQQLSSKKCQGGRYIEGIKITKSNKEKDENND